ncbi:MAG: putative metallopeptidase [Candidatus Nanoarchaeia archaeon]
MGIKYELAPDIQKETEEIAKMLFLHVRMSDVVCLRSRGSTSRGTIARCHALGKAMQIALGRKGFYLIEVVSERFDKLSREERTKTLIHELMHIPKSFGGGFKFHDYVSRKNVDTMYEKYINMKRAATGINESRGWFS